MSVSNFKVNISPKKVLSLVKEAGIAELVHEEFHELDGAIQIGTLVFEKYFFRVKNRVALIVISDNIQSETDVRVISTASSEGVLFNFDWGAANSFIHSVENILNDYLI